MAEYEVTGMTKQHHNLGVVKARSKKEAIRKATEHLSSQQIRRLCPKTAQFHDVVARRVK